MGEWGRMTGRNRPEDTTYAAVLMIARSQDCCIGLFIGNLLCDRIHSRLPGKSLTEVDVRECPLRERQSRAQGGRIKEIKREGDLLEGFQSELPSMSQIRRGL